MSSHVLRSVLELMSVRPADPVISVRGHAVAREIAAAVDECCAALETAEMQEIRTTLLGCGLADSDCTEIIEQVGIRPGSLARIASLRMAMRVDLREAAALERYLLLYTAVRNAAQISQLRMTDSVLRCLADELRFLAAPSPRDRARLLAPTDGFISMAKIVTMRRFPAGQLHLELSGIPLSWFARLSPGRLTNVLFFLARHVRGRGPFFSNHVAWRRKNRLFLTEHEQNLSYFRIAQALALHPEVKGLFIESWLHSPDTFQVSPHLAWLNTPILEHGGLVVVLGKASESCGVFDGSPERKRLYEQGLFRPTTAMAIWPRAAMLDWAMNHPEFGD